MPLISQAPLEVSVKIADYTVLAGDSGKTFSTKGATGTVVLTLPAAVVGLQYRFYVGATQELRVDPAASEVMCLPSDGAFQTGGKYLTANAIGEALHIGCVEAGVWAALAYNGTWTAV